MGVCNLWRFRHDLSEDLIGALEELCKSEPVLGEQWSQSPVHQEKYLLLLESHSPVKELVAGPTYWFKEEVESIGSCIEIDSSNTNLLENGLEAWIPAVPHYRPFMASLEDGQAVSVCSSVRITKEAHAAGVETLPDYRRRGHATGVVRSWAREVQKNGAIAFYSTSWSNNASQSVAAGLGLSFFGTEFRLT